MSQPQLDFEPGALIVERYRVDQAIGRGGFGAVYKGTRLADGEAVALKIMHMRHQTDVDKVKRFQRESALVARLRHDNVVAILDYGHTRDGLPFIVFELLRGHSLKFRIKKQGALSPARTCRIAAQVLGALGAAHALGIVHRDIKPANIYLCAARDDDLVKVLDFGIAKALLDDKQVTQLTRVGQRLGTPAYMSPEQVRGDSAIGPTTDLYSLGLVMAELLSGRKLIPGASDADVYKSHLVPSPHLLSEAITESALGPVVARAVEKQPAHRFQTAAEMLAAVEAAAAAPNSHPDPPRATPVPPSLGQSLADLAATVRLPTDMTMDDVLRQHGILPAPPVNKTEEIPIHLRETSRIPVLADTVKEAPFNPAEHIAKVERDHAAALARSAPPLPSPQPPAPPAPSALANHSPPRTLPAARVALALFIAFVVMAIAAGYFYLLRR